MNAKEAIAKAKEWVSDIYEDEIISNLGLEEVKFDDRANFWLITIGFSRPWDGANSAISALANPTRSYKVGKISDRSGEVLSVENRIFKMA